jgi:hypothetical protein
MEKYARIMQDSSKLRSFFISSLRRQAGKQLKHRPELMRRY